MAMLDSPLKKSKLERHLTQLAQPWEGVKTFCFPLYPHHSVVTALGEFVRMKYSLLIITSSSPSEFHLCRGAIVEFLVSHWNPGMDLAYQGHEWHLCMVGMERDMDLCILGLAIE